MATDPMDALRQPIVPLRPPDAFAARLRRQLEAELIPTPPGGTVSTATTPVMIQTLIPYLTARGADRAIAWYGDVFGAVEVGDRFVEADGRIGHAELRIGAMRFFIADEYPEYGVVAPDPQAGVSVGLLLYVDDVDVTYARGVAAGARGDQEPADQPYGDRSGTIRDPFGHRWQISTRMEDVSRDELERRLEDSEFTLQAPAEPAPGKREGDIGYFTLHVPDVARAERFYSALFGWEPRQGSLPEGRHIENVTPPGGMMGGHEQPDVTLYFRVADVQAAATRVRELGGEVLEINEYPSGGNAVCRDDQGLQFELFQPAPGYG